MRVLLLDAVHKFNSILRKSSLLSLFLLLYSFPAFSQERRLNPFTDFSRLWLEWNIIPNTQWAPNAIDPAARSNKTLQLIRFQPVFPIKISNDWTVISRTVMQFIDKPSAEPSFVFDQENQSIGFLGYKQQNKFGLHSINPSFFFVPDTGSNSAFGVGPSLAISVSNSVSKNKFGVGPALMAFKQFGRTTLGIRARKIWSINNRSDNDYLNIFVAQPVLRYQLSNNWFFVSSPIINADFNLNQPWTLPVGGGIGRSFKFSNNRYTALMSLEAYFNAIKPKFDNGESLLGDWTIRAQLQIAIPDSNSF